MSYQEKMLSEVNDHIRHIVRTMPEKNFQAGDCFLFYKIMKMQYPEAQPFYEEIDGHVYVFLFNRLWDSKGLRISPMENDPQLIQRAENWKS